jgi:hypothetical protein
MQTDPMSIYQVSLESSDSLVIILERMNWAGAAQIVLVWPARRRVELRPEEVKQLLRHAKSLGAELVLVTHDGAIRAAARKLGIPVFRKLSRVEQKPWTASPDVGLFWRRPRKDLRRRHEWRNPLWPAFTELPLVRVSLFTVTLLAILLVALFLIPAAQVRISLPIERQMQVLDIRAEENLSGVQVSGRVPLRRQTLQIDGTGSALSTGSAVLPDKPAVGQAMLVNLTDKAVDVPVRTVLLSNTNPPVPFVIETEVKVPAGKGENIRVPIRAAQTGVGGNLEPGTVTLFQGPLGARLAVFNPEPTTGGSEAAVKIATDLDREGLKKRLLADLQRQAISRFTEQATPGDIVFPTTIAILRVVDEIITPPAGEAGDKFSLQLRVEYAVSYSAHNDLVLLASMALNAAQPVNSRVVSDQVSLTRESDYLASPGGFHWKMRVARDIQSLVEPGQVRAIVQGKTVQGAIGLLSSFYGLEQTAVIKVQPAWWPWMPVLPVRISVEG